MNSSAKFEGHKVWRRFLASALLISVVALGAIAPAHAVGSQKNPQDGSVGLEGTISGPPPTQAATIATPGNGQTVNSIPITISGLCKTGLLVKVFSNNIFIGSAQCANGSYSIQANLFSGRNDLVARVFDALDQAGPDSNLVTVNFNDAQFIQFGSRVTLSSTFAQLGADPGSVLAWPIIVSGGLGPYAISIDWGDGTAPDLISQDFAGTLTIKHVYKTAGIYKVIIKATDKNGTTAFLQLVGVANGKVAQGSNKAGASGSTNGGAAGTQTQSFTLWPMLILLPLIAVAFWLGRRHELYSIRRHLEKSRSEV